MDMVKLLGWIPTKAGSKRDSLMEKAFIPGAMVISTTENGAKAKWMGKVNC